MLLHGFADASLPGSDIVISTGSADAPTPSLAELPRRLSDDLQGKGFSVCRAWQDRCGLLEGTKNAQGQSAAAAATVFVHLEISHSVRTDRQRRQDLVHALVSAT